MNLACAISTRRIVDDPHRRDGHIETCLRCQVEAIRFRHLERRLAAIRHEVVQAPPGLLPAVMAGLSPDDEAPKKAGSREAAAAVAGLAAAVGAVALWRRSVSA
jgi:hypothetical protein